MHKILCPAKDFSVEATIFFIICDQLLKFFRVSSVSIRVKMEAWLEKMLLLHHLPFLQ